MNIIKNHIPISKRRPGTPMVAQYLTIHSTANPKSTARNERAWLVNPSNKRTASWHIVVDEKEAIEAIPLNEVAWHAGDRTGNKTSIGIEICESGDRIKTLKNAVERVADLLKKRNWGVNKLRKHHDWSGKVCPRIMSANNWAGWEKFKTDVKREIKGEQMETKPHWAKKDEDEIIANGYVETEKDLDGALTRGEFYKIVNLLRHNFKKLIDKE